jgi:hypothetical protein
MDTDDESTAQKVIRINENGIGFSTTGINGPYTNAWTIDGALNADFITTGTLDADQVTVHGKIQATSGYIGDNTNGWQIGAQNIHNGPTSLNDTTAGMYVGTNGIRTNGANGEYTQISGGVVASNQIMTANGFYPRNANAYLSVSNGGEVHAVSYSTEDGGYAYTGQTSGTFAFTGYVGSTQKTIAMNFVNGLLVGFVAQ